MNKKMVADISSEIREIGKLITSAVLISAVRNEVSKVLKEGFVVTDGKHQPSASGYEVIVRSASTDEVARRIRANIRDVNVEKIAEGVLGINTARRGSACPRIGADFCKTLLMTESDTK